MKQLYSETEVVASIEGLTVTRLRSFVATACIVPLEEDGHSAYDEADLARLRLLSELVEDFELDTDSAAVVMSLVDQIHGLRRTLRAFGDAVSMEAEDVRGRILARVSDAAE